MPSFPSPRKILLVVLSLALKPCWLWLLVLALPVLPAQDPTVDDWDCGGEGEPPCDKNSFFQGGTGNGPVLQTIPPAHLNKGCDRG